MVHNLIIGRMSWLLRRSGTSDRMFYSELSAVNVHAVQLWAGGGSDDGCLSAADAFERSRPGSDGSLIQQNKISGHFLTEHAQYILYSDMTLLYLLLPVAYSYNISSTVKSQRMPTHTEADPLTL